MIIADLRIYMAKFEKRLFAPPCRICILTIALCQVGIHGPPDRIVRDFENSLVRVGPNSRAGTKLAR